MRFDTRFCGRTSSYHRVLVDHGLVAALGTDVIGGNADSGFGFAVSNWNVLLAAAPLLKESLTAVFYTESTKTTGDDASRDSLWHLCGDLGTMSLFFDLVPTSYLSGFRTEGNTHELVARQLMPHSNWFVERLTWRRLSPLAFTSSKRSLVIDESQMTSLIYSIYIRMFQREALSPLNETAGSERERSRAHYCRRTFALLMRYLSGRIATDWGSIAMNLVNRMQGFELMIGKLSISDYLCQLHQLGVHTSPDMQPGGESLEYNRTLGRCRTWREIPSCVYIAVSIPRSKLRRARLIKYRLFM